MEEANPQQESGQIQTSSPAIKKESGAKIWIAIGVSIFILIVAMIAGFGMSLINPGEPTPGTSGGTTTCSDWAAAEPGYQKAIEDAANKVGIHPALLGAILLSENGDSWPKINMNGPWPHGGAARGPYQIENWGNFWKQVVEKGYSSATNGNVETLADSSLATAVSMRIAFEAKKITPNTTEEKYIVYAGMYHNRGSKAAYEWANNGFNLSSPPANSSHPGWEWGAVPSSGPMAGVGYSQRTWSHFQNLNKGCASTATYKSISQIKSLFGSTQSDVEKHIVSTTFMGKPLRMNRVTIEALKNAEKEIKASGARYQINSLGGYAWRANVNDSSKMSLHSFGLAIDINPPTNPNGPRPNNSQPRDPNACQHDIPDAWSNALEKNGFFWGAKFKNYCDAMHFQYGGNAY